jgi:hypothetical protein
VDGLQVRQLIIVRINTTAEEQTGITSVYDLVTSELKVVSLATFCMVHTAYFNEIGLIFLITGGDKSVDFSS